MSIQRWDYDDLCAGPLKFKGEVFVTYADVDAAIAAAEQRGRTIGYALGQADMRKYLLADDTHSYTYGHREGYADALREAREAVAALDPGPGLREDVGRALAAIDALKDTHVRRRDEVT